jgi:hypothetical protein
VTRHLRRGDGTGTGSPNGVNVGVGARVGVGIGIGVDGTSVDVGSPVPAAKGSRDDVLSFAIRESSAEAADELDALRRYHDSMADIEFD